MDTKHQLAKNFNFTQELIQDSYVDSKDTANHWCVAQVIDIDPEKNMIRVHYDGWGTRYDEWIKKNNAQKLAPFRRHTIGYTGQKKTTLRDFKINLAQMQQMKEDIAETIDKGFRNFESPMHLTQFIRGHLYFYVDSLISLTQVSSEQDLPSIFEFMTQVFRLILKWIEIFPSVLKSFLESQSQLNLYLVDMDSAIASCGPELFDILNKCFGGCQRCQKFFMKYQKEVVFESAEQFVSKEEKKMNGLQSSFINLFGSLRGFSNILAFIDFETQDAKGKNIKGCPFNIILRALSPICSMIEMADKKFITEFSTQVKQSLTYRLENLQELEIKELDKDTLIDIIYLLKSFIRNIDSQNSDQIAEMFELKIADKYLRCNFFEKRVRGINELKEIYYKVQNQYAKNRHELDYMRWLNNEKYSKWILEKKILEFIFIENPHVELIKRSFEILRLLAADENFFTPEIVEMLWNCCKDKHEDIIRATLDLIQELAFYIPLERLFQFSQKFQMLSESEYDEKLVSFLKYYTINTMKNIKRRREELNRGQMGGLMNRGAKKEVKINQNQYIDLQKFWQIVQESNKVSAKLKDSALNALIDVLNEFNDIEQKSFFIQQALENIKRGDTFYNSLIFLRKILQSYPVDAQNRMKSTSTPQVLSVTNILQDIFSKFDIFEYIFQNTEMYLASAQQLLEIRAKKNAAGVVEKVGQLNLNGLVNHDDFIWAIFDFIEFALVNSKVILRFEHVERMFNLFVTSAISENETDLFFQLITKENEKGKSNISRFLLDDKTRKEVFQKIFCNNQYLNSEKINLQGFICFKRLFLIVNEEDRALERQKEDRVAVLSLQQVKGLETLWSIAIQCQNKEVKDLCKDFLVDLYLKIKTKSDIQKKTSIQIFPDKCLQHFKNSKDRPDHQLNCLRLIKNFISRFDGDHIEEESTANLDPRDQKLISVQLSPDKITQQIPIFVTQKLWQLKRKMATAFKLKLSEFYIKTKGGPLEESVYDDTIKEYKIDSVYIQRVPKEEMEREFPRYLIGYNDEYLDQFIDLLKNGSEDCKREALSLLEILPISYDIKTHFKDNILKFVAQQDNSQKFGLLFCWQGMLNDIAKPCYFLMVLEELMIPRKDLNQELQQADAQNKYEFASQFVKVGGFEFLIAFFKQLPKGDLEKDITRTKILTIILRLLTYLFNKDYLSLVKPLITSAIMQLLLEESLSLVHSFMDTVIYQQVNKVKQADLKEARILKTQPLVFRYALDFIKKALISHPLEIKTYYEYPQAVELIKSALIDVENDNIQTFMAQNILEICDQLENSNFVQMKPSYYFMNIFINSCLDFALTQTFTPKTTKFFDLMNTIFVNSQVYKELANIRPILQLTKDLAQIIQDREILEICARDEDIALSGVFTFLKNLFNKFPELRELYLEKNKLLHFLLHDCLFHKETRGQMISKQKALPPKCKNNKTREKCLDVLQELCLNNNDGLFLLTRYLKNQISETYWRTARRNDWGINVHQQERSLTGFVGLKNIGCICYMNSFMQQLFMIPSFRKSILEVEDSQFEKEPNDENVLYQLKMIFGGLMETEKQYFNPKKFCSAFKDIDGQPIDPMVQKDADEFFNMLMDRVENLIKGKKEEKVIRNLFQGVYANEFICKGCPHYSEREEPFMVINLQVKNKHSIKESLDSFVEGEMLEGDNAYFCEKCEKKVNTLKRCCIKRMPNVLFMVLKRFEFNYDTMTKFKINDYCEFPMSINMSDFGQETLAKKDLLKEMQDKNLTVEDLNEDQRIIYEKQIPSKYYDYNLKGVLVHIGTAEQGHYISLSQDRENPNGKWFEFNDHVVREFDPSEIPYETFGGDDDKFVNQMYQQNLGMQNEQFLNAMKQMKTKIKNAYVLIYERDEIIDMEKFNEMMDDPEISTKKQEMAYRYEQCIMAKANSANIQIPLPVHEQILEKNKKFWLSKFIFNKSYIDQIYNIFNSIPIIEDDDYENARSNELQTKQGDQFEQLKFLTTFFLTTVIRAKERRPIPPFLRIVKQALRKNIQLCVWLIETFSNQNLIKEFLIECPIPDMKRFVGDLLQTAMQKVYMHEESQIANYMAQMDQNIFDYINTSQESQIKHHRTINMTLTATQDEPINTSPFCSNVNLFIMKGHSKELPIIVVLINSLMHMACSQQIYNYLALSAQFYQVFAHFSELGEQARLYLLKNKQLCRLLEMISQNEKLNQQALEKIKNESLQNIPLFRIDKEFYIAQNLEKTVIIMTLAEKKMILKDVLPWQTFVAYTISKLARSCIFVKSQVPNPYSLDQLQFIPDELEMSLIINFKNESWWKISSLNKLARNSVADLLAHISFDNKETSLQLIQFLLECVSRVSFNEYKTFERALVKQIMIKDQYQAERTKKILQGLHEIIKLNLSYYKDVDSLIDIIAKMAERSQFVVDLLPKSSQLHRLLEQWTKEYPHIPLTQNKAKIFKQGIVSSNVFKGNLQFNQQFIDRMTSYSKDRLQRIQQLVTKQRAPDENLYDSDDDMYSQVISEKQPIDYRDPFNNEFYQGVVEVNVDSMLKITRDGNVFLQHQRNVKQTASFTWIEKEGDKLAPHLTLSQSEKRRFHNYFMQLLSAMLQGN